MTDEAQNCRGHFGPQYMSMDGRVGVDTASYIVAWTEVKGLEMKVRLGTTGLTRERFTAKAIKAKWI